MCNIKIKLQTFKTISKFRTIFLLVEKVFNSHFRNQKHFFNNSFILENKFFRGKFKNNKILVTKKVKALRQEIKSPKSGKSSVKKVNWTSTILPAMELCRKTLLQGI